MNEMICACCGKQHETIRTMRRVKIYIRRRKRVVTEDHWFCRDGGCAGIYQMALEG